MFRGPAVVSSAAWNVVGRGRIHSAHQLNARVQSSICISRSWPVSHESMFRGSAVVSSAAWNGVGHGRNQSQYASCYFVAWVCTTYEKSGVGFKFCGPVVVYAVAKSEQWLKRRNIRTLPRRGLVMFFWFAFAWRPRLPIWGVDRSGYSLTCIARVQVQWTCRG